ncbi:ATPase [Vibrio sp. Isolate23]|uniref:ATPase n=1 Tax=Vibrio sp. Isolate23 TaxID=2908533 RepID=UPI001EFE4AB9|nr:ATPase [Vibrio sp. Isolate23]MCG9683431.1 ATPase [Vibrio sp. Isolate23]
MKKQRLKSFSYVGALSLLAATFSTNAMAGNPAFPPVEKRPAQAAEQPRFFVKYHEGKEQQARELLRSHDIVVVDVLDNQQVLVVSATQEQIDELNDNELIDYTEPEPIRRLYSQ